MLNSEKVGHFIMSRRKFLGYTQQQLARKLNVSFQAVSKWENGTAYPNVEILKDLAIVLGLSVDEILTGCEKEAEGLSYSKAGIDNAYTDAIKGACPLYGDKRQARLKWHRTLCLSLRHSFSRAEKSGFGVEIRGAGLQAEAGQGIRLHGIHRS